MSKKTRTAAGEFTIPAEASPEDADPSQGKALFETGILFNGVKELPDDPMHHLQRHLRGPGRPKAGTPPRGDAGTDAMSADPQSDPATQRALFLTTRWSLVLTAAGDALAAPSNRALEELCRAYWRPLYAFARRQGLPPAEAEDATQGFFARLLARRDITQADPERGRFRTFLITSFKNYLTNLRRDANRLKRGAGEIPLPIDIAEAEATLQITATANLTPDRLYDRQWAEALLDQATRRFHEHYVASGKATHAEFLTPFLWGQQEDQDCNDLAERMEVSPGAARVALHRARTRFRELVRAEIAQTVLNEEDVDTELRNLIEVLRGD